MIDPDGIPQYDGEPGQIVAQAQAMRAGADAFAATGQDVHGTWQGLAGVYTAPESGQLLAATQPVATRSAALADDVGRVAGALVTFAETMTPIKARLEQLRAEARSFVSSVEGDDDWTDDGDKVDAHNAMLSEVGSLVAEWQAAERACANTVFGVSGSDFRLRADDGDEHVEADEYGFDGDTYDAALEQEVELPWGTVEHEDPGMVVGFFTGLLGDGAWGDVQGLLTLVGLGDGDTSDAWGNLFVLGTALAPGGMAMGLANPDLGRRQREVLSAFGNSMIARDMWAEDPSRAVGQVLWNFGSLGLAGVGAVAKTGKLGRLGALSQAAGSMTRMPVEALSRMARSSAGDLGTAVRRMTDQLRFSTPVIERVDGGVDLPRVGDEVTVPAAPRDAGAVGRVDAPEAPAPTGTPDVPPSRGGGPAPVGPVAEAPGGPDAGRSPETATPGPAGAPDAPLSGRPDAPAGDGGTPDVPLAGAPDAPSGDGTPEASPGHGPAPDLGGPPREAFESSHTYSNGVRRLDSVDQQVELGGVTRNERGRLGEDLTEADLRRQGYDILARGHHVKLPDGGYFVPDFIARAPDGTIVAVESKWGPNASYTPGQLKGYEYLARPGSDLTMRSDARALTMVEEHGVVAVDKVVTYRWNTEILPDLTLLDEADAIAARRPRR